MKTRFIIGRSYQLGKYIGVFAGLSKFNSAQFIVKQPHPFEESSGYVVFDIADIENDKLVIEVETEEQLHEATKKEVLAYLKTGRAITKLEIIDKFRYINGGDLIFNLRKEGYNIETTMITNGKKRFASYKLIENV